MKEIKGQYNQSYILKDTKENNHCILHVKMDEYNSEKFKKQMFTWGGVCDC